MKNRILTSAALMSFSSLSSCSTPAVAPNSPPPTPVPPKYTQVIHPNGMDVSDLSAVLLDESAPKDPAFSKNCDADFKKLRTATVSHSEIERGTKELVKQDPVFYHWCFYGKLFDLENDVKGDSFIDEKQKNILSVFEFLIPVARSFSTEFRDSRYMLWAVRRYQHFSEWVFYRKLKLTPAGTVELVQPSNPFGLYRDSTQTFSILEKYHLKKSPTLLELPLSSPSQPPLSTLEIPLAEGDLLEMGAPLTEVQSMATEPSPSSGPSEPQAAKSISPSPVPSP